MFEDRKDAGLQLADKLAELKLANPLVLALPRGGVPVGFEIAKALKAPLVAFPVRKLGTPGQPELGFGAVAADGTMVIDREVPGAARVIAAEKKEVARQKKLYGTTGNFKNKTVILVDDGLATGVTMRAAIMAVAKQSPEKIIVALPVCSPEIDLGEQTICLLRPADFSAVGNWYRHFDQVTDAQVLELLNLAYPGAVCKVQPCKRYLTR